MATSGTLITGVASTPLLPTLVTVKVLPVSSWSWALPARVRSERSAISAAMRRIDFCSTFFTTGT